MPRPQTVQRRAIESALRQAQGPVSPHEVFDVARQEVPSLSLATVYRTVNRLLEEGEIVAVGLSGQPPRYERAQIAREHHHHFWCQECDTVFDVNGCVDGLSELLPSGFQMTGHEITLHGQCRTCGDSG